MLSRVAERVYWQSRYIERAENTARLLNVYSMLLLDLPPGTKLGWHTLVEITGTHDLFDASGRQSVERNMMRFMLAEDNGVSLLNMLIHARECARTTRELMPTETFENINNLYLYAKENLQKAVARGPRHDTLEKIITGCQRITGMLSGSMSHSDAYRFVRIGRNLERADMTSRIVDAGSGSLLGDVQPAGKRRRRKAKSGADTLRGAAAGSGIEPLENILWMSVLRSTSAYQMYRQYVKHRVNAEDVVGFLLMNVDFPRSVAHTMGELAKLLVAMPKSGRVSRQVRRVRRLLNRAEIGDLLEKDGLLQFIDDLQVQIAAIHGKITDTWFLPRK